MTSTPPREQQRGEQLHRRDDHDHADDVYQETFLSALRAYPRVRDDGRGLNKDAIRKKALYERAVAIGTDTRDDEMLAEALYQGDFKAMAARLKERAFAQLEARQR